MIERPDMKVVVEVDRNLCQQHGQCCLVSPETFQLDGSGGLGILEPEPDGDRLEDVRDAADSCPVPAITVRALEA